MLNRVEYGVDVICRSASCTPVHSRSRTGRSERPEADVAFVLEPEKMNAHNLYVAMTRGSNKLIVCSSSARLSF
ncbi:hypothetical protein FDK48_21500 [Mycobacterium tuberculosis]|nr:hypothetical protein FDK48_21500 [Mycobacterium tuberculosis]